MNAVDVMRNKWKRQLVEKSFTCRCATEAGDAICAANLTLEFVVVGEFLI